MLPQNDRTPTCTTVTVTVTVTDVVAVQRLMTVFTGRSYVLTSFAAHRARSGSWTATVDLLLAPSGVGLLCARLDRLPSVLEVTVHEALSATAGAPAAERTLDDQLLTTVEVAEEVLKRTGRQVGAP